MSDPTKRAAPPPAAPIDQEEPPFVDEGDLPEDAREQRRDAARRASPRADRGAARPDDASVGGEEDPGSATDAV